MRDSDEAIDRVLGGLRDVEPSPGFEVRVLETMRERVAARVGWRPRRLALACALVAIAVAAASVSLPARKPTDAVARVIAPVVQPRRVEVEQRRNTEILRVAQNDLERRVIRMAVSQPQAAGGFPAPPMPLTEQEKLLLRVAHRSDPTELTPLNAEARARQSAAFDDEFQQFFAPPVIPEDQTNSTDKEKGDTR